MRTVMPYPVIFKPMSMSELLSHNNKILIHKKENKNVVETIVTVVVAVCHAIKQLPYIVVLPLKNYQGGNTL